VTPAKKNVPGATPAKQSQASAVGDRPPTVHLDHRTGCWIGV